MVSLDYPPTVGGISAHVYELAKAMIRIGNEVIVLSRKLKGEDESEIVENDLTVVRVSIGKVGLFYGHLINKKIDQLLERFSPDVIHIHGMRPLEYYKKKDIPLVYTNHTSGYLKRIKKGGYRIIQLRRLFQKPDIILAPSEELLEMPFTIRAEKIFISNGVDAGKFKKNMYARKEIRKELNIKPDEKLAIVTRRLVWKNGVNYLALASQFIKHKNLKLLLIGDGEEKETIRKNLEKYFKDRYVMMGSMTHENIVPFYSAADLSVLPSIMEATSISGLEAMASGLPLVGTKVGGIPVLIKDGETGYLCESKNPEDMASKIDKLLESDLDKLGCNSLELVKSEFDWNKIASKTVAAYKKVI